MQNFTVLIFAFLIVGCRENSQGLPHPVEVHLGEDVCSACGMIISDERFGAQLQQDDKDTTFYDDLGCLIRAAPEQAKDQIIFLRSFENGGWVRSDQAFAVLSNDIHSPMGYGIATFATEQAARSYASGFQGSSVHEVSALMKYPDHTLKKNGK